MAAEMKENTLYMRYTADQTRAPKKEEKDSSSSTYRRIHAKCVSDRSFSRVQWQVPYEQHRRVCSSRRRKTTRAIVAHG